MDRTRLITALLLCLPLLAVAQLRTSRDFPIIASAANTRMAFFTDSRTISSDSDATVLDDGRDMRLGDLRFDGNSRFISTYLNNVGPTIQGNGSNSTTTINGRLNIDLQATNEIRAQAPLRLQDDLHDIGNSPGSAGMFLKSLGSGSGVDWVYLQGRSYTPTGTADATGATGEIAYDDDYIYVKTSAGWARAALSTF